MKDPAFHPGFKFLWRWPDECHDVDTVDIWWLLTLGELFQLSMAHIAEDGYAELSFTCFLPFHQRLRFAWRYE